MVPSETRLSNQGTQRTKGACALNQHTAVPSAKGTSYHLQHGVDVALALDKGSDGLELTASCAPARAKMLSIALFQRASLHSCSNTDCRHSGSKSRSQSVKCQTSKRQGKGRDARTCEQLPLTRQMYLTLPCGHSALPPHCCFG